VALEGEEGKLETGQEIVRMTVNGAVHSLIKITLGCISDDLSLNTARGRVVGLQLNGDLHNPLYVQAKFHVSFDPGLNALTHAKSAMAICDWPHQPGPRLLKSL